MNRPADLKWMAHFFISLLFAMSIGCLGELDLIVKEVTPKTAVTKR